MTQSVQTALAPWDVARNWLRACDAAGVVVWVEGGMVRTWPAFPPPGPEVLGWVARTLEADQW